jgi:oligopeptide/dipeptide ABC transporter ATP-binding protein
MSRVRRGNIVLTRIRGVIQRRPAGEAAGRPGFERIGAAMEARPKPGTPVLEVDGLSVVYHTKSPLEALHDVSFTVRPREIVGIVGESGCGKSTLALALMGLLPPNGEIRSGHIVYEGRDVLSLREEARRHLRGSGMAMIFQDPLTSLNPTFTIGTQLIDVQRAHRRGDRRELRRRAAAMLEQVGIPDAAARLDDFPHEFSGGMRQRIMIAMALLLEPAIIVADEATSALDVTLEAQILALLRRLRDERGTAVLFVSHDLGVVAQVCDSVVVMYAGRTVEEGDVFSLYERPLHPYTQALLATIPSRARRGQRLETIPGRVPSLSRLPPGCKFVDRCPYAQQVNREREPRYVEHDGRRVRCNIYDPSSGYELTTGLPPVGADARA